MLKALIHVKPVRRPVSGDIIAFRVEAAVPNMQGRTMKARHDGDGGVDFYATEEPAPSFRRPYFIKESSDELWITKERVERFLSTLQWEGYTKFEFVGKFDGEPLDDLMR